MLNTLFLSFVSVTLLFSSPVIAETQTQPAAQMTEKTGYTTKLEKLYQLLGLSAAQQDQFKDIVNKVQPTVQAKLTQMGRSRLMLSKLIHSETYTPEAVNKIASMQGSVFTDLVKINTQMKRDVYEILTPEQRTKLLSILQQGKSEGSTGASTPKN